MLVLLLVALWFILRGNLFYVLPCVILFLCLFGEERASLGAFRTFVRFALVWFRLFPLSLGVCDCGTPWTFLLPFFYTVSNDLVSGHQRP